MDTVTRDQVSENTGWRRARIRFSHGENTYDYSPYTLPARMVDGCLEVGHRPERVVVYPLHRIAELEWLE